VQVLLGGQIYRSHELTFAGNLIACGHCGRPITGEVIHKKTGKVYRYYRCARYTAEGHPRVRLAESKLDRQMLSLFDRLRIEDEKVRHWFAKVLRERTRLEIVCLNFTLDDANLVPPLEKTLRRPRRELDF
jgi:hypothetical protein